MTIRESTTLLLGYGLGDVNVLTALDWSRNVFKAEQQNYPSGVIQVLRKDGAREEPYRDKNGIVIVETLNLSDFFVEFIAVRAGLLKKEEEEQKLLKKLADSLDDPNSLMISTFIDNCKFRASVLKKLSKFSIDLISGFVSFLNKCIDETWSRSAPPRAFEGYNQNLIILLDILTSFSVDRIPPALFQTAAYGLERVGYFVGDDGGQSWAAKKTWDARKSELTKEMVKELKSFAEQHRHSYLIQLVNSIAA